MATDATGSPTPKGIPKYDTANDAPSGLGFNAAMDAIDSLLGWAKARRNSAGNVLSRGRFNFIEGAGITITIADDTVDNEIDVTITHTATAFGTVLPGAPADGDEFILTDSITAPTWQWRLRYVAAKASNKWVFIGGSPGYAEVVTNEGTASTTYAALATVGPNFVIPVAGDYLITQGFKTDQGGAGSAVLMSYDIGGTGAVDADAVTGQGNAATSNNRERLKTGLTAVTLTSKYKVPAGISTNFGGRWMRVTPQAIGG